MRGVFRTRSEAGTLRLAKRFGRSLAGDEVVFLIGELGAGKTVFAKGVAAGLGLRSVRDVCSPTFTLLNVYQARVPVYHLDLYRLGGGEEVRDLGFEDYVGAGVILVEWGEKVDFPLSAVRVTIEVEPGGGRRITVEGRR
ncbi:MAG: tRNA (adenosine(37)-N6)-threonylcarbamoyltransferase complex ATPase subunit type 1 TsaE [Candidatus Aminicenantes bacterium]|nr:tRNA (adenosine(37)-N6)-threonylcarbamoyltransferase complex ATPase subunit type 1 TsaE [Candidatus Aminicenantes bacterium]